MRPHALFAFLLTLPVVGPTAVEAAETPDPRIQVRAGYELTVAVPEMPNARFMEIAPDGTLFVSQPNERAIQACRDTDGDGVYDSIRAFVRDRTSVHAMQWHEGWLWFAYAGTIARGRDTDGDDSADEVEVILGGDKLVAGGGHWWRSLLVLDGRIYTGIGDSGNIDDETETKRQKVWSYALDGSDERLFCSGLRNTEKLVVRPGTSEIWGMDHGSDWFGGILERPKGGQPVLQPITDLNPPCEMNRLVEGGFYGHPFITGNRVPRYEYMDRPDIVELAARTIPPEWLCGAHWAPNAMEFYTGTQIPEAYGDAFVAYHGSWNSSQKVGYAVSRVYFENGHPWGEKLIARFVDDEGNVFGRPVDVVMEPDGSLLVSDDYGNRIYRLRWVGHAVGGTVSSKGRPVVTAPVQPLALSPIRTYQASCARCHGPEAQNLLAGEVHRSEREDLRQIVEEMMRGTAELEATDAEIEAMTDYMLALEQDLPFAVVTEWDGEVLSGEARPGDEVQIRSAEGDSASIVSVREGINWSVQPGNPLPLAILLRRGDTTLEFRYPERSWPLLETAAPE